MPTTLVLPIVGLDIETIISGNFTVLWFGAEKYEIPHHQQ